MAVCTLYDLIKEEELNKFDVKHIDTKIFDNIVKKVKNQTIVSKTTSSLF
jgi:hypothetical protein